MKHNRTTQKINKNTSNTETTKKMVEALDIQKLT